MFNNFRKRLKAMETVVDALIVLADKKKLITKDEIQVEILDRASSKIVNVGGIEYKLDKDEEEK